MTAITSRIIKLDSTRTGIVMICLLGFIWALMEILTQIAAREYSLYQVIWVRYAAHLLFMLIVFGPRQGFRWMATGRPGLQLVRALMMLIMPVSFILAVEFMPVNSILAIFWLSPFMIFGLSALLLKEMASWRYWAIALFGFVCILIITRPSDFGSVTGIILSAAMGLSFSLYVVMTRMLRDEPTLTNLFYTAVGVLIPLSFRLTFFWKPLTLRGGLLMIVVGLLGFGLLWILDKAMDMISPTVAAAFFYSQMFWIVVIRLISNIL